MMPVGMLVEEEVSSMHWNLGFRALAVVAVALVAPVWVGAADGVRVIADVDYVADADYADNKDKLDLYLP